MKETWGELPLFEMRNVTVDFGPLRVLENFTLRGEPNCFLCLLGTSGVGKTTILNLFAGTLKPFCGSVVSRARRLAYVFQEPRLLPWMTVEKNMEVGLYRLGGDKRRREEMVRQMLQKIGLERFAGYYPEQLSGGMKQRVSIGRAYVIQPDLLLLDEPFTGLDEALKTSMQDLLQMLSGWHRCTTIMVTHDIREAIKLGDRIIVIHGRPGRIVLDMAVSRKGKEDPAVRGVLEKQILSALYLTESNLKAVEIHGKENPHFFPEAVTTGAASAAGAASVAWPGGMRGNR
jgi:NitT/TauT family transport system ATP-binding protein